MGMLPQRYQKNCKGPTGGFGSGKAAAKPFIQTIKGLNQFSGKKVPCTSQCPEGLSEKVPVKHNTSSHI